jgi:GTPase SAR1 family protein
MNKLFYNNSRIVIFVYDITSRESFEDLNYWINEVSSQLGDEDIIRGIIGNKIDLYLQEAVNDNDVEKLTKKINGKYLRMSAKEDEPQKIENYLEELLSDYLKLGVQGDEKLIDLSNKSKNKIRKNCC